MSFTSDSFLETVALTISSPSRLFRGDLLPDRIVVDAVDVVDTRRGESSEKKETYQIPLRGFKYNLMQIRQII